MLADLKLAFGPWTVIFQGTLFGYESNLISNKDSIILVEISQENSSKVIIGATLILSSAQSLKLFSENLEIENASLAVKTKEKQFNYLLTGVQPRLFDKENFEENVNTLIEDTREKAIALKEMALGQGITLDFLKQDSIEAKEFFINAQLIPLIASQTLESHIATESFAETNYAKAILGLNSMQGIAEETLMSFNKTLIEGNSSESRLHLMHILIENALLSKIPAIILDANKNFQGLTDQTKNLVSLQKFKMETEPIGFPVKHFKAGTDFKVNLSLIKANDFKELIGFNEEILQKNLEQAIQNNSRKDSIEQLIKTISLIEVTPEFTEFEKNRLIRIVKLFNELNPGLLNGTNDLNLLTKSSTQGIAKASIIDLSELTIEQKILMIESLVKELDNFFKENEKKSSLKLLLFLPEITELIEKKLMQKTLFEKLINLSAKGIGFIIGLKSKSFLEPELQEQINALATLTSQNDVSIQIQGRQPYRIKIRPGLSSCDGHLQKEF